MRGQVGLRSPSPAYLCFIPSYLIRSLLALEVAVESSTDRIRNVARRKRFALAKITKLRNRTLASQNRSLSHTPLVNTLVFLPILPCESCLCTKGEKKKNTTSRQNQPVRFHALEREREGDQNGREEKNLLSKKKRESRDAMAQKVRQTVHGCVGSCSSSGCASFVSLECDALTFVPHVHFSVIRLPTQELPKRALSSLQRVKPGLSGWV